MRQIVTHILLPFAPEQVWSVLADFRAYAEWNPLNVSAEGYPTAGARVRMTFIDPGHPSRMITQNVTITAADAPRKLEWVGSALPLFRGRHFFELHGVRGSTDLHHGESLSGLLPHFWGEGRIEKQRLAYQTMNKALLGRLQHLFACM